MKLIRRALLIMSPEEDIPGVTIDRENWKNHLRSPAGGAWQDHEVTVSNKPTISQLSLALSWANSADYTFIAFSGHGSARSETDTVLCINDKDTVSSMALITRADRQTLILDCCRKLPQRRFTEARVIKSIAMDSYKDPDLARLLFDQHLRQCDPFRVQLNGCAVDQTSGESDSFGGYYTSALIRAAQATPAGTILGMREAHQIARRAVMERQPSQIPTGSYPRSGSSFPIGIGL